jgi:hypothetical protein
VVSLRTDQQGQMIAADVRIDDLLTNKQVSRHIELGTVPFDSRALTIAVGIDELLAASWAELALRRPEPTPTPEAPPSPRLPQTTGHRRVVLGMLGSAELDAAARPRVGGELRHEWWFTRGWAASVRLGYLRGVAIAAPDGRVHTSGFWASGGAKTTLVEGQQTGLELGAFARFGRTLVTGEPLEHARGFSEAFSSFGAEALLQGYWVPGEVPTGHRWALVADLAVGAWLREAAARDGSHVLALERSPLTRVSLGAVVQIP